MMNAEEATLAQKALTYPLRSEFPDMESYKAAREEHGEEVSEITGQFRDWLEFEYAGSFPTQVQDLIFHKAWEDGHSSGYFEVEGFYEDYADFAEKVRRFR